MKLHYTIQTSDKIGRLFIPLWEWNSAKDSQLFRLKPDKFFDIPQWQKDIVIARHELLKKTPYTQLLDFDTTMDEVERSLNFWS